ncbi:MAG: class I SAM-dependent methyltransferase [Prosthecobacter sp.]|nr:class I SAM-dependent methyltransferase [Prosthecobacter sp.]
MLSAVPTGGDRDGRVALCGKAGTPEFWLYNTFRGLNSSVSTKDEMGRHAGDFTECYTQVVAHFRPWSNVKVVQGIVPDVLHTAGPDKVAFLHIDLNATVPERAAIEFFWPRLVPGAMIVFDDYAWVAHAAQKQTIDLPRCRA